MDTNDSSKKQQETVNHILFQAHVKEYEQFWESKDVVLIGRILRCHLILEYCLNKWIKHSAPHLALDSARLTFSQKLKIFEKSTSEKLLSGGMKEVNSLRNKVAHTLHDPFAEVSIPRINYFCTKTQQDTKNPMEQNIAAVEMFARFCCAWLEGRMSFHIRDIDTARKHLKEEK